MVLEAIRVWLINTINWLFNSNARLLQDSSQSSEPIVSRHVPEEKPVSLSRVTMTEIVLPSHADTRGFVFGGVVLGWIDVAAGTAAKKHAVTRSVDAVHFMHPIKVGDFLVIQASVNRAWNTSMEVGVRVETENPLTGKKNYCCHGKRFDYSIMIIKFISNTDLCVAYLTFVALRSSQAGQTRRRSNSPVRVPRIVTTTAIEAQRFDTAEQRRIARISKNNSIDKNDHKNDVTKMAELMRKWSERTNTETMSSAEIPPLLPDPNESDDDPAKLFLRRRKSTLIKDIQQPDDKPISDSFAEVVETVLPQHANTLQITFGGQIMQWMEQCSLISATRHARRFLLLASIDSLQFLRPTYVGYCITVRSMVSCTFHSSMEVYVTVEAENLMTGETFFTNDGFYTMVAVDATNIPKPVPHALIDHEEKRVICDGAVTRRKRRLQQRRELVQKEMSLSPDEFQRMSDI
ncbi:1543_t:CDS:2 [Ambispora gerdemannii]|uniref:1543_t:CDS:1 n=1 Tax=Ambispora gerdemannii TaxID=144530 RepID=A0A9N8WA96_9GLOM|nr:1543_t:CDS:2 [Ambispora gerdemannii]